MQNAQNKAIDAATQAGAAGASSKAMAGKRPTKEPLRQSDQVKKILMLLHKTAWCAIFWFENVSF